MGFQVYSIKEPKTWRKNSTKIPIDRIPIFLFPGILGAGTAEFSELVKSLLKLHPNRSIYVYNDPIYQVKEQNQQEDEEENSIVITEAEPLDLETFAQNVINEMRTCLPLGPMPFILGGYSFGGALAAKITSILQKDGYDARLLIIDAPTPAATQAYFKSKLPVSDLIAIMQYVCKLSGFTFNPDELDIHALESMDLNECIDTIAKAFKLTSGDHDEAFQISNYLIELVKRNLGYLLNDSSLELMIEKEEEEEENTASRENQNLVCLITQKLASNYGSMAGWEKYHPQLITDAVLLQQDHSALIAPENCDALAAAFGPLLQVNPLQLVRNALRELHHLGISESEVNNAVKKIFANKRKPVTPGDESADSDDERRKQKTSANSSGRESARESDNEKSISISSSETSPIDSDDEENENGHFHSAGRNLTTPVSSSGNTNSASTELSPVDSDEENENSSPQTRKLRTPVRNRESTTSSSSNPISFVDSDDEEKKREGKRPRIGGLFDRKVKIDTKVKSPERVSSSCPNLLRV